jgi:hypothetical protein
VAGTLMGVAAEAIEVGVRGALGSVLDRASKAAGHAADTIDRARRRVEGDDE